MSRIGKLPVALAKGVTATVNGGVVTVKGPKGELKLPVDSGVQVEVTEKGVAVTRRNDAKHNRCLHGLFRALINNMVTGVSTGFARGLEIEGVGYTAKAENPRKLSLNIGFNAPVVMEPPEGVTVETPKPTIIMVKGCDRQKVGQFASEIRGVRPPEPYKGKGIRYSGEHIIRKAGKAVGGKSA